MYIICCPLCFTGVWSFVPFVFLSYSCVHTVNKSRTFAPDVQIVVFSFISEITFILFTYALVKNDEEIYSPKCIHCPLHVNRCTSECELLPSNKVIPKSKTTLWNIPSVISMKVNT